MLAWLGQNFLCRRRGIQSKTIPQLVGRGGEGPVKNFLRVEDGGQRGQEELVGGKLKGKRKAVDSPSKNPGEKKKWTTQMKGKR